MATSIIQLKSGVENLSEAHVELISLNAYSQNMERNVVELTRFMSLGIMLNENPPKSGRYESQLEPGPYRLFICKQGYEEYHKEVTINAGLNSSKINLRTMVHTPVDDASGKRPYSASHKGARPLSGGLKKNVSFDSKQTPEGEGEHVSRLEEKKHMLTFRLIDSATGKPLPGCVVKILDYQTKRVMPVKADEKGECTVDVTETYEGKLIIERNDYFKIEELYGEIHNFDLTKFTTLDYPMIQKPTNQDEITIMLHAKTKTQLFKLHVLNPAGDNVTNSTNDIILEHGVSEGKYSVLIRNLKRKSVLVQVLMCLRRAKWHFQSLRRSARS
jgi:hypothetical protein